MEQGGEELMLDMLPRRLDGIAEQLLGKGQVLPADGSSVGQMLGVPDDDNFVKVLEERGKSDIGADALCARWLHKLATEDWCVCLCVCVCVRVCACARVCT